ncbi:MAG: rod shape-determining protein MreD [Rickettsiales bacterium]
MQDIGQKLDHTARMMLPGILTIFLLLLLLLPFGMAGLAYFPPDICLISVYYWVLFRPSAFPFWFVFLLGILQDALLGVPLGMSSFLLILFRLLVLSQHRQLAKETFWAIWVGFGILSALFSLCAWLLASVFESALLPFQFFLMQWLFTIGLYPLAHLVFNRLYHYLPPSMSGNHHKPLL